MTRQNYHNDYIEENKKALEPFTLKQLFVISNHDADDMITAVCSSLTGAQVAIGTLRGRVYFVNRDRGSVETRFEPHTKKIT